MNMKSLVFLTFALAIISCDEASTSSSDGGSGEDSALVDESSGESLEERCNTILDEAECLADASCTPREGARLVDDGAGGLCSPSRTFIECGAYNSQGCDEGEEYYCTNPNTPDADYVIADNDCGPAGYNICEVPENFTGACAN